MTLVPTNELVAQEWVRSIPGLTAFVDSQLPSDESVWTTNGAVIVNIVGGAPNIYLKVRNPVIQVDCWQNNPNSDKLPWNLAVALAEQVRTALEDDETLNRLLTISVNGVNYQSAWAQTAYVMTEPRRVYSDAGDYAGCSFDCAISWTYEH